MHDDEEIRYILSGAGFWDIRGVWNVFKDYGMSQPLTNLDMQTIPQASGSAFRFFQATL